MYHADRAISATGIKRLLKTPLDFWVFSPLNPLREFQPQKSSSALAKGSAFHCLLLEPHEFSKRFEVKDGVKSSRVPGKVGGGDLNEMMAAIAQLRAMPNVSQLFTDGEAEVTMVWDDPETGVRCRCRHDYFRQQHGMTVDYKTIADISEREIDRQIVRFDYHVQAALYLDGMKALKLGDHQDFVFVFQQRDFPHKVYATTICDETIEIGRKAYKMALRTYATMMERYGAETPWPSFGDKVHVRTYGDIQMHAPSIDYGYMPVS
ncbi:MAG: PD-(D/E)XK nuclease-like domain-containing protein [Rhizobiaceae bacterium]